MRLLYGGAQYAGRAVELGAADPAALAARVREGDRISRPDPTPAHRYVGCITPDTSLSLRAALAAAARTRGLTASRDDDIADLEREAASIDPARVDLAEYRERAAERDAAETELQERVARLAGKVEARREVGESVEDAEAELRRVATELSEVETERLAAQQALALARERARERRAERERRRRLADRADNLRQKARKELAERVYPEFVAALDPVPTPDAVRPGRAPETYVGDDTSAALAIARLAALRAPVVVACGRFESARDAAEALRCPVIRVQNSA